MSAEKPKVSASVVVGAAVAVVAIVEGCDRVGSVGAWGNRKGGCVGVFWVCLYAGGGGNGVVFVKKTSYCNHSGDPADNFTRGAASSS